MHDEVKNYYGEVLQNTSDLQTSACCTLDAPPAYLQQALKRIHDEVSARYYGCGLVVPESLEGMSVLDLGCGAGRDVYTLAQLVGPDGFVVGVDMTTEQLDVARRHQDWHAEQFGHGRSNVEFIEGTLEHLDDCGLDDERFDVIVSNCVINLVTDKQRVFDQAWRLLKPGGELFFADIYTDRRVPEALTRDPVLYGECLSGALYWNDFLQLARHSGFVEPRLVTDRPVTVDDPELAEKVGDIRFYSATCRLFKLPALESTREDYGLTARYLGTIEHCPDQVVFDRELTFTAGEPVAICGNTFRMLHDSRLARHFELSGRPQVHAGPFLPAIDQSLPFAEPAAGPSSASGCC